MLRSRCRSASTSSLVRIDDRPASSRRPTDFLPGHGCGKLLQETSPGVFNFDTTNPPVSPLTGKPITTWYKPGQTWGSVFGGLAGAYEVWPSHLSRTFRPGLIELGMPRRAGCHAFEVSSRKRGMSIVSMTNPIEAANSRLLKSLVSKAVPTERQATFSSTYSLLGRSSPCGSLGSATYLLPN